MTSIPAEFIHLDGFLLPDEFWPAFGYEGQARFVGLFWTPFGREQWPPPEPLTKIAADIVIEAYARPCLKWGRPTWGKSSRSYKRPRSG